jgi:hypothetical protein
MQLMRTEVNETTSVTGDLIQLVRFCGEGGECVTVKMALREGSADNRATALERARAILVQTAAFEVASSVYDAESNGNSDHVTVTTAEDEPGSADPSGWLVRVRDEAGKLVCAVTVEEAEMALKAKGGPN